MNRLRAAENPAKVFTCYVKTPQSFYVLRKIRRRPAAPDYFGPADAGNLQSPGNLR